MKLSRYKSREILYKKLFLLRDASRQVLSTFGSIALFIFTLCSILFICLFLFDLGFKNGDNDSSVILKGYLTLLSGLFSGKIILELTRIRLKKWISLAVIIIILVVIFLVLVVHYQIFSLFSDRVPTLLSSKYALVIGAFILIVTETYRLSEYFDKVNISPRLLFAGSFFIIIMIGSGLLMMPNATNHPISYLNALFTATSAVCVTGLVTVDTVTTFTPVGVSIILFLIQIGGLGIMTFTGFFSYIFIGSASLRERFILKDLFSGEHLGSMFRLLFKILTFTFIIEIIGALFIYIALNENTVNRFNMSVFHSISAFCNAGFSIFTGGLANSAIRYNYFLQITIAFLIIMGGLGFPVLLTFYNIIKQWCILKIKKYVSAKREPRAIPFLVGQKLAFWTSVILLIIGMFLYFSFEKNNSLSDSSLSEKLMISFFGSTSARTAGFNIVEITNWSYPTIFVMIFLMWIGASPGSTGGGIKTTTLALALKSSYNYIRGRNQLEIGNREIGLPTLTKVLATIVISIMIISIAFLFLMTFEPAKNPVHLMFECFSAYSTVGLSIAGTSTFSSNSIIILILLMYIGRISPLILLSGFLFSKKDKSYRLPVENIAIN